MTSVVNQLQVKLAACGNPTTAAVGTAFRGGGSEVFEKKVIKVDLHVVLSKSPHCVPVQVDCGGNQVLKPRDESYSDAVRLGLTPNPIDAAVARGVHSLGQEELQLYRISALHRGSGAMGGAVKVVRDNEPNQLGIHPDVWLAKGSSDRASER